MHEISKYQYVIGTYNLYLSSSDFSLLLKNGYFYYTSYFYFLNQIPAHKNGKNRQKRTAIKQMNPLNPKIPSPKSSWN